MLSRNLARQFGRDIYCHRNLVYTQATATMTLPQAVKSLSQAERSAVMQWIDRQGPFWNESRTHDPNEYFECNGQVVTDSAIGEAAFRRFNGLDWSLFSLTPSTWGQSPLIVEWKKTHKDQSIDVLNHITLASLDQALRTAPSTIDSWSKLSEAAKARFTKISFSNDAFTPLQGHPFVFGAAERIIERLDILNKFLTCFDNNGVRTKEGHSIYQEYFTGDKAWFSDSSDREKIDFKNELTFGNPIENDKKIFCPMHGKVKSPQLRIHFSWPIQAKNPFYVVYVGPKITKY